MQQQVAPMQPDLTLAAQRRLIEATREACIQAALEGYENAALSGLCREGAWESAISAIRMLTVDDILSRLGSP